MTVKCTHEASCLIIVDFSMLAKEFHRTANPRRVIVVVVVTGGKLDLVLGGVEIGAISLVVKSHGTVSQEVS